MAGNDPLFIVTNRAVSRWAVFSLSTYSPIDPEGKIMDISLFILWFVSLGNFFKEKLAWSVIRLIISKPASVPNKII